MVLTMHIKRLFLITLLLSMGCQRVGVGNNQSPVPKKAESSQAALTKELRIYRNTLLEGKSDQIRLDAANILLFSEKPRARTILLEALGMQENLSARNAVFKSLNQARAAHRQIRQKDDFIEPILDILANEQDTTQAELAAEATLVFEYSRISGPLEKMATDDSLAAVARTNAICALKLHPDMEAIFSLIRLLDDSDNIVASAAGQALKSLGIPVAGKDLKTRQEIIEQLRSKGRDEFLRNWLIRQEARMDELDRQCGKWRDLYLSSLEQIYQGIDDSVQRGRFLVEHLSRTETAVKLWTLSKVEQWRKGTNPRLPGEVEPVLLKLISDDNRDIRLQTAGLLSLMEYLNSAEALLAQLKAEPDEHIRLKLLVALGGACSYAFSPDAEFQIPDQIRTQTLELAAGCLSSDSHGKAQTGAEVIKKLLEQAGLAGAKVNKYISLLAERYNQPADSEDDILLRGELLNVMAGLCAGGPYRKESARLFKPLFEQALGEQSQVVREAAVSGLIYIDQAEALKILRKDFVNDSSPIIRAKLIELAGRLGGQEDLNWLWLQMVSGSDIDPWPAMLKIFKRSGPDVLDIWLGKFELQNSQNKLSDSQQLLFFEMVRGKAAGAGQQQMLERVWRQLVRLYTKRGQFEQAAEYLGMLHEKASTAEQKRQIADRLMDVYLRAGNYKAACLLVSNRLLEKDLDSNSVVSDLLENYFATAGRQQSAQLLNSLAGVDVAPDLRPVWAEKLKKWREQIDSYDSNDANHAADSTP